MHWWNIRTRRCLFRIRSNTRNPLEQINQSSNGISARTRLASLSIHFQASRIFLKGIRFCNTSRLDKHLPQIQKIWSAQSRWLRRAWSNASSLISKAACWSKDGGKLFGRETSSFCSGAGWLCFLLRRRRAARFLSVWFGKLALEGWTLQLRGIASSGARRGPLIRFGRIFYSFGGKLKSEKWSEVLISPGRRNSLKDSI